MDLLKAQFERIQKQLAGLTASQRMLTVSLVAIMVITLIWWGKYAGEAEMEPLLNQSFAQEDITRISSDLTAKGITYSVAGDRILVPSEKKVEVLASLSYGHLLPRDTKIGFDEMVSKITPLSPESTNDRMFNRAKEMMLSQIIQNFPHVEQAEVMIDPTRERRVEGSIDPSATVTITMQHGDPAPQQLVDAAADVVQGAQSGLARSKIKIVVGGIPRRLHDNDAEDSLDGGNDQLELVQKNEVRLANKLRDYLSYIPDLKVSVTVRLNTTTRSQQSRTFDPKTAVQKETETTSENEESNTPSSASAAEAGVAPNTGLSIKGEGGGGGGVATTTHEKNSNKFENFVPETTSVSKTPAGDVTVVGATVRVPTSFFAAIYMRQNPTKLASDAMPTDAQLRPLIDIELGKIRNDVLKCTGVESEKSVAVETYPDAMPVLTAAASTPTSAASMSLLLTGHSKELVLGGLAVMSLFMVSMMVRKGMPAVVAPVMPMSSVSAVTTLDTGEIIAGEAGVSGATLDGMELDDDAVRAQQMVDQVSTMVKENPEAAASLVKRWLNRT